MSRVRREAELSPHAQAWLERDGYTPFVEVAWRGYKIDIVGRRDDALRAVEMKMNLSRDVLWQGHRLQLVTSDVWCLVAAKPRSTLRAEQAGLGVAWFDGTTIVELVQPRPAISVRHAYYAQVKDRLTRMVPGGVAGLPMQLGLGPAQACYERCQAYVAANPNATWKEMFCKVPNHYASPRSMQQSMGKVVEMRAIRERRRAMKLNSHRERTVDDAARWVA